MTDKLSKLISEVLELDEKATPEPWHNTYSNWRTDSPLILRYRTLAPKLAKACEVMWDAIEMTPFLDIDPGLKTLREALAEVEKILSE